MILDETVFSEIKISGVYESEDSFLAPNVIESSLDPTQFGKLLNKENINFINMVQNNTIIANMTVFKDRDIKLVTAALYNRVFSRDGPSEAHLTSSLSKQLFFSIIVLFVLNLS